MKIKGQLSHVTASTNFKITVVSLPPVVVAKVLNQTTNSSSVNQISDIKKKFAPSKEITAKINKISIDGEVYISFQQ